MSDISSKELANDEDLDDGEDEEEMSKEDEENEEDSFVGSDRADEMGAEEQMNEEDLDDGEDDEEMRVPKENDENEGDSFVESDRADESGEISAEEQMNDKDLDDGGEEEEMRVPKKNDEERFVVNCQPSSSATSDSAFDENASESLGDFSCADTSALVISEKKTRKRRTRTSDMPPKGTKEYKEYRSAEAKRRRIENAEAHRCPFCPFAAPYPSKVKIHLETNHRQGRFECKFCPMIFDTQSENRKHAAEAHPLVHTCEHCGYTAKFPNYVRTHIRLNHVNGIKCTVPGCTATVAKWCLKRHLREKHPEASSIALKTASRVKSERTTCAECDFSTTDADEMNDHFDRVHSDEGIACPHGCGEKLRIDELRAHLENVHDDVNLKCSKKEDQKTPSRSKSTSKTKTSGEDDGEVASTSGLTASETYATTSGFVDPEELSDVLSEASEIYESSTENRTPTARRKRPANRNTCGAFTCEVCCSTYDTLYLLKKHAKRTHERAYGESKTPRVYPKHLCTFEGCTKVFRNQGMLQDHLNKHNKVFAYHCTHCSQAFYARARYAVHLSKYHNTSIRIQDALRRDLPTKSSRSTASSK